MATFGCPSCGAPLEFRSSVSVYTVCSYCGTMAVRSNEAIESIGTMSALPEDISPLQIGTVLTWANRRYTLLGRDIMAWADGSWTEWFMDAGGMPGWLAHAQGFFSTAFEHPLPPDLAAASWPVLDARLTIDGTPYRVADLKQAHCIGSEGELPFPAVPGRIIDYADMLGPSGTFASLEQAGPDRALFVGANATYDELHFENLRPVEGWAPPKPGPARAGDPQFRHMR